MNNYYVGPHYGQDGSEIPPAADPATVATDPELDPIPAPEGSDEEYDTESLKKDVDKLKVQARGVQHWLMDGDKDGTVSRAEVKTFALGALTGWLAARYFGRG